MARKKETFLLVSLNEDKAKKLAEVISNQTCRKILDYLAEIQQATETKIAKDLNIPLPTVHYNLKHLVKGNLIESEEYHYSEKGKEVNHYKLANKFIIIAPKTTHGIKEKLRSILPVALVIGATTAVIQLMSKFFGSTANLFSETMSVAKEGGEMFAAKATEEAVRSAPQMVEEAAEVGADAAIDNTAAPAVEEAAVETVEWLSSAADSAVEPALFDGSGETAQEVVSVITQEPSIWQNIALWFFIGAVFSLILYLIISKIMTKKE